ncbi:hypothetical protein BJV82DRAFT_277878 [Fennellomyces sp. T-0311]|nr:hypothetical protein BJV82DRAFT_277878 [Fennellomyces sp. T-0311]
MDDLLDLDWSAKSPPPNIPQKPSYLQGNKKKPDAFADLLQFDDHQPTRTPPPAATAKTSSLDTLLDPFGKSKKEPSSQSLNALKHNESQASSQWNFDLLDNSRNSTPSADPFDVESLASRTTPVIQQSTIETDDDNPLGILSMPAPKPASPKPPSPRIETPPPVEEVQRRGSMDMLIAQMVDMGFEAEQAQVALEATGGRDLQDAVDLLVNNNRVMQQQQQQQRREQRRRPVTETERARQALFDDEPFVERREPVMETRESSRERREHVRERQQQRASPSPSSSAATSSDAFQQQKDKLMAQATELGGFLYKNASMFVKSGREKVSKAVEDWQEQQRQERLNREHGRPRWMSSEYADEEEAARQQDRYTEKFVDNDDSSDEDPALERQRELNWKRQQEEKRREYVAQMRKRQQQEDLARQRKEAEEVYVSPSRRRATPSRGSSRASTPQQRATPAQPPPPQPKPQRQRPIISASPNVMQRVNQARQRGNEYFKLGQFGDAESAYTQAISALPSGHDHLVLLSNNRAAARLKIGEYKRCIEDCELVVEMARVSGESIESEGVVIQWREQLVKALHRKGDALENIEKYQEAMQTYNELIKLEGSGNTKINQALSRCRKALNPTAPKPASNDLFAPTKSPSPAVKSKPASVESSKAVAAMRAQAAQQEAEDAERLARTDDVNARIQNWKKGKEQNLRALLATLDTLLWPGAQWRGAQMSELIDPKRCKITYLKAIAKVHPDKLPSSVTVEQRMLASAIFTTLNEAWDSFKTQL